MYEVDTKELRKLMIDADILTIDDLYRRSGVNRVTAGEVLSGKSYPSALTMARIAEACSMEPGTAWRVFFKKKLT